MPPGMKGEGAMPMRRQGGFTLLELMITVAVFIVLAALAIPGFQTYFEKSRLRGAADDVVSAMALARQGAVKQDRDVAIAIKTSANAWCLGAREAATPAVGQQQGAATTCDCSGTPANCTVDAQPILVSSSTYSGVKLSSASSDMVLDGRLGIRSDGDVADADKSSFDLTSKSGTYVLTVSVTPLGQASVCSKSGNILGYPAC